MRSRVALIGVSLVLTACGSIPTWVENLVICLWPCARTSVPIEPIESAPQVAAAKAASVRAAQAPCNVTGRLAISFAEVRGQVFEKRCGLTGACHLAGSDSEGGLDLASADAPAELLANASGAKRCDPNFGIQHRVVAGDPQHSMLWQVVSGSACGPQMPLRSHPLNCDDQERIYSWIRGGAHP